MGEDKELEVENATEGEEEHLIDDDFSIMPDDDWSSAVGSDAGDSKKSAEKGSSDKDIDIIPDSNEHKKAVVDPTILDIPTGDSDSAVVPDKDWENSFGDAERPEPEGGKSEKRESSDSAEGDADVFDELDDVIPTDNEHKDAAVDPTQLEIPPTQADLDSQGDDFHVVPDKSWDNTVGNPQRLGADIDGVTTYIDTVAPPKENSIDAQELDNIMDSISSDDDGEKSGVEELMAESSESILEDEFLSSVPVSDNDPSLVEESINEVSANDSEDMSDDIPEMPDLSILRKGFHSELDKLAEDEDDKPLPVQEAAPATTASALEKVASKDEFLELSPADEVVDEPSYPPPPNPLVDVVEARLEDVKVADLNISGSLSDEEIQAASREIQIKREDIEELFGMEDELQDFEDDEANDIVDLEKDISGIKDNLSGFLTEESMERIINDAVKSSILDLNETIFREKLGEALENMMPQIVAVAEKAVWDIVPDMARTLIKKEIDKIREEE